MFFLVMNAMVLSEAVTNALKEEKKYNALPICMPQTMIANIPHDSSS